jgi:serine/threonine protein kinase
MQGQAVLGGRWTIANVLGQSDAVAAYLVLDRMQSTRLLEVVRPEFAANPQAWSLCEQQARAAQRLKSRLFAHLVESGVDPQLGPYLLRESVPRASLASRVAVRGPLTGDVTLALLERLAVGVEEAHRAGIVHCGLGPWCVMVGDDALIDTVRVGELGIAHLRVATPAPWPGPMGWTGLTQAQGAPASPLMDVQTLALLAFFALTGQPLFASLGQSPPNPEAVLAEMRAPPRPSERAQAVGVSLSSTLDAVFTRALSPSSGDTYGTPTELVRALEAALKPRKVTLGSTVVLRGSHPPSHPASSCPQPLWGPAAALRSDSRTLLGMGTPLSPSTRHPQTLLGLGGLNGTGTTDASAPPSSGSAPPPLPVRPGAAVDQPQAPPVQAQFSEREPPTHVVSPAFAEPIEFSPAARAFQVSQAPDPVYVSMPAKSATKPPPAILIAAGTVVTAGVAGLAAVALLLFFSLRNPTDDPPSRAARASDPATRPSSTLLPAALSAGESAKAAPLVSEVEAHAVPSSNVAGIGAGSTQVGQYQGGQGRLGQRGATVKLACAPACAELDSITCDDQRIKLAKGQRLELASGTHRCVLREAGYESKTLEFKLQPGELREMTVRLARRQAGATGVPVQRCGTFINPCK